MNVSLPIKTKDEFVDGKRITEYAEKTFELDLSLNAQMRWEQKFAELASNEELAVYSERIKSISVLSAATIISKMKVLYCFFDTTLTFPQFLKLFDFSTKEYVKRLSDRIMSVFEIINEAASEKN